jgi:hypothetical protein
MRDRTETIRERPYLGRGYIGQNTPHVWTFTTRKRSGAYVVDHGFWIFTNRPISEREATLEAVKLAGSARITSAVPYLAHVTTHQRKWREYLSSYSAHVPSYQV